LSASGPAAGHLIGFGRGPAADEVDVVALASRHTVTLEETGWGDTTLDLPPGLWVDRLTGRRLSGTVSPAQVFADLPVAALARD
ncbi:hypothetical protein GQ85_26830, partial [Rhodococcus rhodochrous]